MLSDSDANIRRRQARRPRRTNGDGKVARPIPYDPLSLENLAHSVERALLDTDPVNITEVPETVGAGIYALYYTGDEPLYAPISNQECSTPIYVGKAVPQGGRKGLVDPTKDSYALWTRLQEHKESLEQAENLDVSDFRARYLVVVPFFVGLAEEIMIRKYQPVWNLKLDGFGNHDPGENRRGQGQRPAWDEVHPGRWWSQPERMPKPNKVSPETSRENIRDHLARLSAETPVELDMARALEDLDGMQSALDFDDAE
ncbi:Eco29kI family restriction endonuclease [Saccharothrix sp.]|uniref:Eco29kI family restriction endonuclease n=1 Tax=Saccharothrix sp. TaxID=1873460 RepID=UPI002812843A|nr:Eco29kI family restriction endonuclease [Saccharothrix sp.]